ncbi:hypothetical protein [Methylococcus sp. EFPC2]|uniref:hypothetical protein n=1 Tax=Methylococcus sp. EFPC2 TaxID=2812648 RepID=UPI001966F8C4|nr:hypothetical protein [Methylococcus sp. EFPC2]QSA96258.1 hypothetical protein JWZ97_13620 [Methylococcus sp. EFPC2]
MSEAASAPLLQESLPHRAELAGARERLGTYFARLGLDDPARIDVLVEECLRRASGKVAPGSIEELKRRALEEAQRCFELSVARILGVAGNKEPSRVAAARAALLLGGTGDLDMDQLFLGEETGETALRLRAAMPQAVPPEAHLSMHEQPISFFFSGSN